MKTNQYIRARSKHILGLLSQINQEQKGLPETEETYKFLDRRKRMISFGYYPNTLDSEDVPAQAVSEESDAPLTDYEISQFDNYFVLHPENILGTQIEGSGFLNPIRVKGEVNTNLGQRILELSNAPSQVQLQKKTLDKAQSLKLKIAMMKLKNKILEAELNKI